MKLDFKFLDFKKTELLVLGFWAPVFFLAVIKQCAFFSQEVTNEIPKPPTHSLGFLTGPDKRSQTGLMRVRLRRVWNVCAPHMKWMKKCIYKQHNMMERRFSRIKIRKIVKHSEVDDFNVVLQCPLSSFIIYTYNHAATINCRISVYLLNHNKTGFTQSGFTPVSFTESVFESVNRFSHD